ncbi:MAG: AAA family ATPase, partial [Aestuariivita sp.]|nr:AAA family ATPase [Aestuariivita sp.]
MLSSIDLKNFGPLRNLSWQNLGRVNLIIGGNGTGKTFLLKALYSAIRTIEEYKRGNDQRTAAEILADKLYWTFQSDKIGDLVTKGAEGALT